MLLQPATAAAVGLATARKEARERSFRLPRRGVGAPAGGSSTIETSGAAGAGSSTISGRGEGVSVGLFARGERCSRGDVLEGSRLVGESLGEKERPALPSVTTPSRMTRCLIHLRAGVDLDRADTKGGAAEGRPAACRSGDIGRLLLARLRSCA